MAAVIPHWQSQSSIALLEQVRKAQITGMGGGGFPTAQKLAAARVWQGAAADRTICFIANGVACEPGIDADPWIMDQAPADVLSGAAIVARVLGTKTVTLALGPRLQHLQAPLRSAWEAITEAAEPVTLHIHLAGNEPAAGAERALISAVTQTTPDTAVPPAAQGFVVQNLVTLWAISRAITHGETIDRRPVTIGADTRWVAFGTPLQPLADAAQCQRDGGLWSSVPLAPQACVSSQTLAVHPQPSDPASPCIGCGECAAICPAALDPEALHRLGSSLPERPVTVSEASSQRSLITALQRAGIDRCVECGACNAYCPSHIDLLAGFRRGKRVSTQARAVLKQAARASDRFERHEQRLASRASTMADKRAARLQRSRSWTDEDAGS